MAAPEPANAPAWMSWAGITAILLGLLFLAQESNEWMRQLVIDAATPADLELPLAECPADELEEEGLSVAECEQLVADVRSYVVSRPAWFAGVQAWLAGIGSLLALGSIFCGALLANYRRVAARAGTVMFAALVVVNAGHFVVAQQAGPILRAIHLPVALLWFSVHLALAIACFVAQRAPAPSHAPDLSAPVYGRFAVASHWFIAISIFFLFFSSWWMLSLPLPSDVFRYREFPFQLHKNLGITIMLLLVAVALVRLLGRNASSAMNDESLVPRNARLAGHIVLYALIIVVCVTGFMSSTYSGWATTFWWVVELPYWGREDEDLNQLYSDLHLWACWGLLLAMAGHIGAALLHAFRNDGIVRRILRW